MKLAVEFDGVRAISLPRIYAADAFDRMPCEDEYVLRDLVVLFDRSRVRYFAVNDVAFDWLIGDAEFYADAKTGPEFVEPPLRASAKRAFLKLQKIARAWK